MAATPVSSRAAELQIDRVVPVALAVPGDPVELAARVASVVPEDPVVPAARAALVVPEDPVVRAALVASESPAVPVALERELARAGVALVRGLVAALERELVQVEAVAVPSHRPAQLAVALRTKSAIAAHPHDLVPLLEAGEDLAAAVAETTREPAAAEAGIAWEVADTVAVAVAAVAAAEVTEAAVAVAVAAVAAAAAEEDAEDNELSMSRRQ